MTLPVPPSRLQLQTINKQSLKYSLDQAEKDFYLAAALSLIAHSPLAQTLVFKGGTALHHCHLSQFRFSEDIDFSCQAQATVTLDEVKRVLEASGLFKARKEYVSPATIKIERLRYAGILAQAGSIKVEIDHQQSVLLPALKLPYRNVWGLEITLPVMAIGEMAAEKLRAASQRARYRDFYDLFLIFETYAPSVEELAALLRQKEIRRPITVEGLRANWQRAQQEHAEQGDQIHYSRAIEIQPISELVQRIQFSPITGGSQA